MLAIGTPVAAPPVSEPPAAGTRVAIVVAPAVAMAGETEGARRS
jgi:hypothetical protein